MLYTTMSHSSLKITKTVTLVNQNLFQTLVYVDVIIIGFGDTKGQALDL